jgi:hypothetical protein
MHKHYLYTIIFAFLLLVFPLGCNSAKQTKTPATDFEQESNPGISAESVYDAVNDAVNRLDAELLKDCIVHGADVKGRMLNGQGNTPLAEMIRANWRLSDYDTYTFKDSFEHLNEMITILLEAGAVPQYWMLRYSYYTPAVIKILLEHGALTHPESPEWGDPPQNYSRPESLLLFYCNNLDKKYGFRGYES